MELAFWGIILKKEGNMSYSNFFSLKRKKLVKNLKIKKKTEKENQKDNKKKQRKKQIKQQI